MNKGKREPLGLLCNTDERVVEAETEDGESFPQTKESMGSCLHLAIVERGHLSVWWELQRQT